MSRACTKTLSKFQNVMTRIVGNFQSVSYLRFILAYCNNSIQVVHDCSVKEMYQRTCKRYQENLFWSSSLTSCRPRACNCIKTENVAQVFLCNFSEVSQSNLLQSNRKRLLQVAEWCYGKIDSRNQ